MKRYFAFFLVTSALCAQDAFEVATIRPSNPAAQGKYGGMRGSQFYATNVTLSYVISWAYSLHPDQLTGGPGWLATDKFDLVATPNISTPSTTQLRGMTKKLLTDRFGLVYHADRKQLSVYTIGLGKIRLTRSTAARDALPTLTFNFGSIIARNASIQDFADVLQSNVLDRPVLDKTSLIGRFDFTLEWAPDEFQYGGRGATVPQVGNKPGIFAAFEEQLGLKLESTKAEADVFVIDRVQRPSGN